MIGGKTLKTVSARWAFRFVGLTAALFIFRLWFTTTLPLSGDEAYHWEWSRHPAFGYYDHPGLTAYLIHFFTWLFGRSTECTVRLAALVCLTVTAAVCFLFARDVARSRGGTEEAAARAGFISGLLVAVVPVFAILSFYISTDPPLVLFWTLTLYLTWRASNQGGILWWLAAGFCLGLAMLGKFLAFFLLPVIGLFFLLSPKDRRWLKRPHPYVACAAAALVISPFLWWNATHGWATFVFNFVARQEDRQFSLVHAVELVAGQLAALSPGIMLFAVCGMWRSLKEWAAKRDRAGLLLGLNTVLPLAYFFYTSLYRRIGAHWLEGVWLGSVVYLPCWWEEQRDIGGSSVVQKLSRWSIALSVALTVLLYTAPHIPTAWVENVSSWLGVYSERVDLRGTSGERFGWRELGRRVEEVRREMLSQQKDAQRGVFVICGQYGLAASVAFYTPSQIETHLWTSPKVHGENYRFWDDYRKLGGQDAIFVCKRNADQALPMLKRHFTEVAEPERLPIYAHGREVRSFFMVRCRGFDGVAPF